MALSTVWQTVIAVAISTDARLSCGDTASRVHLNSVPLIQMRCRITASRRARATTAFFFPQRVAT